MAATNQLNRKYALRLVAKLRQRAAVALVVAVAAVAIIAWYRSHAATGIVADAQTVSDVAYASKSSTEKLDLYLPARNGVAVPLVIHIHGGGFSGGSKGEGDLYMKDAVLAKGWAIADVNYRLSGEAKFPAGVQDVRQAVRWLLIHAAEYGLDDSRFAAWGESAGGYFSEMLGVTSDLTSNILDDSTMGDPTMTPKIQAVVALYAPNNFGAMDDELKTACSAADATHNAADSPESSWLGGAIQTSPNLGASNLFTYLGNKHYTPPFYLAHGDADCTVPIAQSVNFKAKVLDFGGQADAYVYAGKGHADPAIDSGSIDPGIAFIEKAFAALGSTPYPATPTPSPTANSTPAPTVAATPVPTVAVTPPPIGYAMPLVTPLITPAPVQTPAPVGTPVITPVATTNPQLVPGDLDQNGKVDIADLTQLLLSWKSYDASKDVNRDQSINVYDLSVLLSHWSQ